MRTLSLPAVLMLLLSSPVACLVAEDATATVQTGVARRVLVGDDSKRIIAIIDADDAIEWQHPVRSIHDAWLLPNGNVLFQTDWTNIVEVNPKTSEIVWTYNAAKSNGNEGKSVEVHAFQPLEGGLIMIAESGPARIIEVDREGKLHKQIKLKVDHPHPHRDTRMARKLDNGHYLACHEADGAVREYDGEGKVVWEYEVPMFGKEPRGGHGPESFGNAVYGALRLPNGNTLVATGNGHSVLEVSAEKQIVWSVTQKELPGITLAWTTMIERLPNGNTIIVNCHAGPKNPQMIEVTPQKKVVWTFKDFKRFGNSMPVGRTLDSEPR